MAKDSYLGRLIDREFRCRAGSSASPVPTSKEATSDEQYQSGRRRPAWLVRRVAGYPPQVVDIVVAVHDLAPEDPRQPGDIIVHDADLDQAAFAAALEAAAARCGRRVESHGPDLP